VWFSAMHSIVVYGDIGIELDCGYSIKTIMEKCYIKFYYIKFLLSSH